MRIKDIVNLKGCYSAKDVGDLELPIIKENDFLLAISSYHSGNVEEAGEIYQALLREFIILFKPPKE